MKKILFCIAFIVSMFSATAADIPTPKTKCGPWVVGVTDTEMTIVWISDIRSMGWVEVAPDDGTSFYATQRPRFYEDFLGRHLVTKVHHVRLTGLKPGTVYRYRIFQQGIDDNHHNPIPGNITASNVYSRQPYAIRTLDSSKSECRFSMVNDIHGRDSILVALTKNTLKDKPDFMVFNGDMASYMGSIEDIERDFLKRSSELWATDVPLVYVRGNHETRGPGFSEFLNLFPTKTNTPCFTFRHGPVAFVVLDSGEDKPDNDIEYGGTAAYDAYRAELAKWLSEAIESEEFKSAPVKIALLHIPFSKGDGWYGNNELKRLFLPLLNKAGIDLMLSGHNHRYSLREPMSCDGNEFPILVNAHNTALKANVDEKGFTIKVIDTSGAVKHTHSF
jgi:predicted phosphodiesterase